MILLRITILFFIQAHFPIVFAQVSKRYDVEEEAHKLFGAAIPDVIQMFRMSPDYMTLLNENVIDIMRGFDLLCIQVLYEVHGNLTHSITTNFDFPDLAQKPDNKIHKNMDSFEDSVHSVEKNLTDIERLENYPNFNKLLTISERNRLKEHGFEMADKAIEIIINQLDADIDKSVKPTSPTTTRGPTAALDENHNEFHVWSSQLPNFESTSAPSYLRTGNIEFLDIARLRAQDPKPIKSTAKSPVTGTKVSKSVTKVTKSVTHDDIKSKPARRAYEEDGHTWKKWVNTKSYNGYPVLSSSEK